LGWSIEQAALNEVWEAQHDRRYSTRRAAFAAALAASHDCRGNKRIPTGKLNRWLRGMESQNPAPLVQGRQNRLRYITQIKARPPTFGLWLSRPDQYPEAHERYVVNGLRRDFDLPAVPVRLVLKASKNPYVD